VTWQIERGDAKLELAGELRMADAVAIWRTLRGLAADPGPRLDLDLSRAATVDGAIMSLLVDLRASLAARGVRCELVAAPERIRPIVHLYRGDEPWLPRAVHRRPGAIARLGRRAGAALERLREAVGFAGDLSASSAALLRRPLGANWRSVPSLVERAGADGLPIVVLLNFLLGFVMAFQTTHWLELYGANIYVADVVGISVTRELAPLMTAIIVSGRSGAAFAAELGTMRVSEEIDALRTMGFSPVPYLIVPRVLALAVVAPVLTLIGDVVGVLGGLAVGIASLDLTPSAYVAELRTAVVPADVWTGLVKSVAFGIAIAIIGCHQGLATRGTASAVGRATTSTVVRCLFTIVIVDTLFTVLFRVVHA
jgi:phospholipid/cholesterol/gamma-HCH transport system permease protein